MKPTKEQLRYTFFKKMENNGYTKLNYDQVSKLDRLVDNINGIEMYYLSYKDKCVYFNFDFKYKEEYSEPKYKIIERWYGDYCKENENCEIVCKYFINTDLKCYFVYDDFDNCNNTNTNKQNTLFLSAKNYLLNIKDVKN